MFSYAKQLRNCAMIRAKVRDVGARTEQGVLTSSTDHSVRSFRATLTSSKSCDDRIISYSVSPSMCRVTVLSIFESMWYAGMVEWHWYLSISPETECRSIPPFVQTTMLEKSVIT